MLSSSPRDVQSFLVEKDDDDDLRKDAPFLQTFLKQLPHAIRQRKDSNPNSKDPVTELFQYVLDSSSLHVACILCSITHWLLSLFHTL